MDARDEFECEVPLTVENVVGLIVAGLLVGYLVLAIKYPDRF